MVKILPSGEIVPDDDPRAQRQSSNRGPEPENRRRQGFVQHDNQGQQMYQGGQTVSIFEVANQKLIAAGFPRWNAGPYTVEPIVSVGFILAGLLLGIKGLLLAAILFAVCQWSTQGQGAGTGFAQWFGGGGQGGHNSGNNQRGGVPRRPGGGGPGHRLGR